MKTKTWLQIEGLLVFICAICYGFAPFWDLSWFYIGLFVFIFFAFDLSMLGYLINPRVGAHFYNLIHSYTLPIIIIAAQFVLFDFVTLTSPLDFFFPYILPLWLAHIGFDRMIGYGLKETTSFHDTHLGRIVSRSDQNKRLD